jgi:hypothetical protein
MPTPPWQSSSQDCGDPCSFAYSNQKALRIFESLDPDNENTGELMEMLTPYDSSLMKAYEVSTLVNSPKNQGEELAIPVS